VLEGEPVSAIYRKNLTILRKGMVKKILKVDNNKVTAFQFKPFKEFLAGNIENTDNGIQFKSNESVLFWQRPLRSQKNLLGKCTFRKQIIL
jgi:CRISPR-associated endonuclease Csn1